MNADSLTKRALQTDITQLAVDAIVNAANTSLSGGGGVDGAIHRAAGPQLLQACRALGGCPAGEARITDGYRLAARHVIHAVGPVWRGGRQNEARLLADCYRNVLDLVRQHHLKTLALPAISCGAYGYPAEQAVTIAVNSIDQWYAETGYALHVTFACFDRAIYTLYRQALHQG